ncbi:zinc finger CCCH domain-containing protein 1 [Senna tora]|uniref:Zinc finger CCCH domain-containing protein 1 n=1 Tax=Senna tora TaxID=362788 RepID=A0A834W4X9_9FABA|nr:zinc finger CCCH domain-containing protein 1 [Senna tora]
MAEPDETVKSADNQQPEQVCSFFRKPVNRKNIRKRTIDNEDDDGGSERESSMLSNQRKTIKADNKLYFSTGPSKSSRSSEPNEQSERKGFQFESSKEIQVQHDSRATAILETETDFSRDARAIRERALKQAEEKLKGKDTSSSGDQKLYKGINSYTDYKAGFRREQTIASEKAGGSHGPLRASAHIRVSARFDYQPDICKDYKETGYCGYGDSCKFMHDRGDYKSGWQLEKEWDEAEKARRMRLAAGEDPNEEGDELTGEEDDDDALPFACFICREPFVDPVVTKCKHYFCEHCALKHHTKNKKCFVCNQPTLGIFNTAHEIRKKMAEEGK